MMQGLGAAGCDGGDSLWGTRSVQGRPERLDLGCRSSLPMLAMPGSTRFAL